MSTNTKKCPKKRVNAFWCLHFFVKGQYFVNLSCEMHFLKLPITRKCKMKTMFTKKTCQNTPLNMNYFDKYLQLFPSKFYAWRIFFLLFLGEILSLVTKNRL